MGSYGFKVCVSDVFLLVADDLEFFEAAVQLFPGQCVSELFKTLCNCVTSGMLSENDVVHVESYRLRRHDLVSLLVGKNSVLVYACLVGKSVLSYDRLVDRCCLSDDVVDSLARTVDLRRVDPGVSFELVLSCPESHYDFLHGSVAGSLTESIDSTLYLSCTAADSCQ